MKELYHKYLQEKGVRRVNRSTFIFYLSKYGGYDAVISFLKRGKRTTNHKVGTFKARNIDEVAQYAIKTSAEKAARRFNLSKRTIYRYIERYKGKKTKETRGTHSGSR